MSMAMVDCSFIFAPPEVENQTIVSDFGRAA